MTSTVKTAPAVPLFGTVEPGLFMKEGPFSLAQAFTPGSAEASDDSQPRSGGFPRRLEPEGLTRAKAESGRPLKRPAQLISLLTPA